MELNYKSPLRKLVSFFEISRDKWKEKAQKYKQKVKLQRNRIKFLEESKAKLKQNVVELKKRLAELNVDQKETSKKKDKKSSLANINNVSATSQRDKVLQHSYCISIITMWCQLILIGATSLRAASRVLSIILPYYDSMPSIPSWYTGRLWLLRLGYYKLTRDKVKADDWIWIIDHSIQTGAEKCFVILGIRLSTMPKGRALTYSDVEPIELLPVTKSNGEITYKQLEDAVEKTGVPRAIVGDYGSDIKLGCETFCKEHNETDYIYDIKHKMASLLKNKLNNNEQWENFIKLSSQTKQQLQQTALAPLAPPKQRSKARYMNTEYLLGWGENVLLFLSKSNEEINKLGYDADKVKEKIGWVIDYKTDIEHWNMLLEIATITEQFVRRRGLCDGAELALSIQLNEQLDLCDVTNEPVHKLKQEVLNFVREESAKAKSGECLLGSSEIIESVFGKQKFIEKEQSRSGFTGLLLALCAIVSETTATVVRQALETTSTKMVQEWYKKHIKKSVQAKRIEAFCSPRISEQIQNQHVAV